MKKWEERIAILILNYNSAAITINNAKHLCKLSNKIKIIIIDNCSTDNSLELLHETLDNILNVYIIENPENKGYACGNNVGFRYIDANFIYVDAVVIMNPDIFVNELSTFKRLYLSLISEEKLAIITTQTIYNGVYRQPNDFGWQLLTKRYMMFSGTIAGKLLAPNLRYTKLNLVNGYMSYIDIAQGCFFMVKLDIMRKIQYLDENTFLYAEEAILGKKLRDLGYKEAVLLNEFIHHDHTVKNKSLIKKESKLFDMKCFYQSRKYYILNYSDSSYLYKIFAKTFLNIDYFLKRTILNILMR